MLGEYGEAEDVAQDAYLRWNAAFDAKRKYRRARPRAHHRDASLPRPLALGAREARGLRRTVAPRTGHLRTQRRSGSCGDARRRHLFALMLALERLAPLERAAFLLHDVLEVPFAEVAQTLGRAEPAVRKLATRAREHVRDASRHSRTDPERTRCAFAMHSWRRFKTTIPRPSSNCSLKASSSPAMAAAKSPPQRCR